jgi:hypothetical protein
MVTLSTLGVDLGLERPLAAEIYSPVVLKTKLELTIFLLRNKPITADNYRRPEALMLVETLLS